MVEYREFSRKVHTEAAGRSAVVNAQIELTYGCNLYCVHCYTDCYNQRELIRERELPYAEVVRILDELHEQGVLWVCFTGGEIFMRKDFLDIYEYGKKKGFVITLFTNLTLITRRIADYLADHPPFLISTSLHGATEETFERVTQVKGSFKNFQEALRLVLERRLPIEIKTKAMTLNKHELGRIKAFVENLGLRFRVNSTIYPRLNGDLTPCRFRLSPEEIVALEFPEADCDDEPTCATGEAAPAFEPPPDDRLFRCGCGTTGVHINAWGHLGACTWVSQPRADLRERSVAEGIAEVFPRIRAMRYESQSLCRKCHVYTLCEKMPAIADAENGGDREQPVEHFCQLAFKRAARIAADQAGVEGLP